MLLVLTAIAAIVKGVLRSWRHTVQRNRLTAYWDKWRQLVDIDGDMCFYCREEAATCIDHVLPYSYAVVNDLDNLRLSCSLCNLIASDKIFKSVDEKRWYIQDKRAHKHLLRHAACTECGAPFVYREQSPSLLLCAECYDAEYRTRWAARRSWQDWLVLLDEANMSMEVYRLAGKMYRDSGVKGRTILTECLVDATRSIQAKYNAISEAQSKARGKGRLLAPILLK